MTATIQYEGNLRCNAIHLQSGSPIETDAPTDNKGKGERFSPTDLVYRTGYLYDNNHGYPGG